SITVTREYATLPGAAYSMDVEHQWNSPYRKKQGFQHAVVAAHRFQSAPGVGLATDLRGVRGHLARDPSGRRLHLPGPRRRTRPAHRPSADRDHAPAGAAGGPGPGR